MHYDCHGLIVQLLFSPSQDKSIESEEQGFTKWDPWRATILLAKRKATNLVTSRTGWGHWSCLLVTGALHRVWWWLVTHHNTIMHTPGYRFQVLMKHLMHEAVYGTTGNRACARWIPSAVQMAPKVLKLWHKSPQPGQRSNMSIWALGLSPWCSLLPDLEVYYLLKNYYVFLTPSLYCCRCLYLILCCVTQNL